MTRINAGIPPAELSDKHLIAEHREIKRIPNVIASGKANLNGIPEKFTMGKGHVKFFYNKIHFLYIRYLDIYDECLKRGFKVTFYAEAFDKNNILIAPQWNNWKPTKKANALIRERINLRNKESMAKKTEKKKIIHITEIDSSNLDEMEYDVEAGTLVSTFKHGGKYQYFGVTKKEFDDILRSESLGKAHSESIVKGGKEFVKLN